jgi:hypothetical protein
MKMKKSVFIALSTIVISGMLACGGDPKAGSAEEGHSDHMNHEGETTAEQQDIPEEAKVYFVNLQSGDEVTSPLELEFGVEGMTVQPAGELIEGTGHHHLLIDRGFIEKGTIVPADSMNIHYGDGSTSTTIELSPGKHTLTLQFADGYHQSYGGQMSSEVEIFVAEPK